MRKVLSLSFVSLLLASASAVAQPAKGAPAPPPTPKQDPKAPPKDAKPPEAAKPPPPPAEVKATVDAFKGNWKFDATLAMPGAEKPAAFKMSFNCKAVAGNTAVSCDSKAKTPMGPFDAVFLIAYDPFSKAVHFMAATNTHEVHDHVCAWKGTDLGCTPLKGGMGPAGDPVTEDLSFKMSDPKNMVFTSVMTMKDGSKVTFEGKGKR